MNKAQFWHLIELSYAEDADEQSEKLKMALVKLSADDILAFQQIFRELKSEAYRWDLWTIAYIVNDGCSDDCFTDFRSMLIRRGELFFNSVLANPEEAALTYDLSSERGGDMFGYSIIDAYEAVAGTPFLKGDEKSRPNFPAEPAGTRWEDEELVALFPRLCAKFG